MSLGAAKPPLAIRCRHFFDAEMAAQWRALVNWWLHAVNSTHHTRLPARPPARAHTQMYANLLAPACGGIS